MRYYYFISYQISMDRNRNNRITTSLENSEIVREKIIDSFEEVKEIEQKILSSYGTYVFLIKIINFQLIRSE